MGSGFSLACNVCSYREVYFLGIGMHGSPAYVVSTILPRLPGQEAACCVVKAGGSLDREYGYKLFYCQTCHAIERHFYFSITYDNEKYTPTYECGKCRKQFSRVLYIMPERKKYA